MHSVRALAEDLDVALARQARVGADDSGIRAASAETPLPFGYAASEVLFLLDGALHEWATTLAVTQGWTLDLPPAPRTRNPKDPAAIPAARSRAVATAAWLVERVEALALHPDAEDGFEAITYAIRSGWRTIDRPMEYAYAGPCLEDVENEDGETVPCSGELRARPHADVVTCPECGAEHDAGVRRAWLLDQASAQLVTATEASRALPLLLGRELSASAVRNLAHRGRLTPHPPHRPGGPPLYRVGEVADVVLDDAADEAIQKGSRRSSLRMGAPPRPA